MQIERYPVTMWNPESPDWSLRELIFEADSGNDNEVIDSTG